MKINQLLTNITPTEFSFSLKNLCLNSQQVQMGDVFVALQGATVHGLSYVDEAISNGCVCVLVDSKDIECSVPTIRIDNLKTHLSVLAKTMYVNALDVEVIGITGTNGKTSVACFTSQLLSLLGVRNAVIGTLGIGQYRQYSGQTTPDIFTLYRVLNDYFDKGIKTAVLEVSSHSIDQNRIAGLNITHAVFTNLTQDHLDYHQNFKAYQDTKMRLFSLTSVRFAILNQDDNACCVFTKAAQGKKIINFGLDDFDDIRPTEQGFLLMLGAYVFELPFLGEFNLLNVLAAFNTVKTLGFDVEKIIPLLHKLTPPSGRMQKINFYPIWVDYAHTPDALKNVLTTLKQHRPHFKIRLVFGCGGNRDKDKRAKMGKIASTLADTVILTNDNPRKENPQHIIDDILTGVNEGCELHITLDRQLAIETAITTLQENECLLIAGKGHETVQQFKNKNIELSDIEIVQNTTSKIKK